MMGDFIADAIEVASPYLIGLVVGIALGAGYILYKDRDYKQHLRCAGCQKKMFSSRQDEKTSDNFAERDVQAAELDQRKMEFARYLVVNGHISDQK